MLRCEFCRGHAHAGLAHLHGLSVHLCADCTKEVMKNRPVIDESIDSLKRELMRLAREVVAKREGYLPQRVTHCKAA